MLGWLRTLAAAVAAHVPATLGLAFLALVAAWGAANDWQAPRVGSFWKSSGDADRGEKEDPDKPKSAEVEADLGPVFLGGAAWMAAFPHGHQRVTFPSEEAVEKAGLRWVPAEERPVTEYVLALGTIDYDPTTYAHLATR